MIRAILIAIIAFTVISCKQGKDSAAGSADSTQVVAKADTAKISMEDFKETYKDFFYSIIDGRAETFNKYIHPDLGLYIIDSKGALPMVVNVKDISKFVRSDSKSFFEFDRAKVGYELIEEELPKVNCDQGPDFYSKQGAFTQAVNTLSKDAPWQNTDLSSEEKQRLASAAETVMITVINTSNYRYYFSKMGDKWYVTFIDVRRPCNA